MVEWLGFSTTYIDTPHAARSDGRSGYNWRKLMRLAVDGIISFSNRPLYLSALIGGIISTIACVSCVCLILYFVLTGLVGVPGWLSLMAATTFIGGLILFNLGVIGLYLGRLYDQTKQRPLYVIDRLVVGADAPGRMADARNGYSHDRFERSRTSS
jgi:dolichol-phosphate mannosyltransferase